MNDQSRPDLRLRRLRQSIFFVSLPFGILMFALPLVGRSLGASALEIGGLFSTFALMLVVLRPFVGHGLDRFGRRPFLVAGLLGYALANAGYALAGNLRGLYLARLSQGLGSGLMWLAAYAVVADLAPAGRRGGRYGQIEEMSSRGGIFGAAIGFAVLGFLGRGNLTDGAGWSTLFWLYTVTSLVGALIAWRGVPETLSKQMPPSPPNPGGDVSSPEVGGVGGRPWRLPGQLRGLMGIALLTSSASALLAPILMIYLRDHVTPNLFGLATAYLPAAFASAFLPSRLGRLSDRYGRRLPIAIALLVGAVVSTFIPQVRSLWPLALLWVLEAAAFAAATPAQEALVVDIAGAAQRGTAFGYYTAAASLGAVIGPLLGGWIYDTYTAVWAFRANALMLGLGAVLILLVVRPAGAKVTDENG
ncbi:MAG: MFS transporter [Chloroflexi bacterium]|nr:MFS transporter [Chloroflexota bacterium]